MADKASFNLGSFGPGTFVNMKYTAPSHPSRLAINLKCGQDIALHVNPRYDERVLVLNSCFNGHWQNEERPQHFPLNFGHPTQVTVAAGDNACDIFANKREFCYSFQHRTDVAKINNVEFNGCGTKLESTCVGKALPDYGVGKVVYIHGQAAPAQKNFIVDFVPSLPHDYRSENIAMHLSCRFAENTVVRNTMTNNSWGGEERGGGMPFTPGQRFTMIVVAQKDGFEVGVNGSHFTHYRYRLPLTNEMSVAFRGSIPFIEKVEYC